MGKRIIHSIGVIIFTLATITGGVMAWFTFGGDIPTNVFTAGTVNIHADETVVTPPEPLENWFPGDVVEKEFTIENTGSKGIYLRAFITGAWESIISTGNHSNTATVTGTYKGVTYSNSDMAHYYVDPSAQKSTHSTTESVKEPAAKEKEEIYGVEEKDQQAEDVWENTVDKAVYGAVYGVPTVPSEAEDSHEY